MGKALDDFIEDLQGELRTGGGATLDELFNLALAVKDDLDNLQKPDGSWTTVAELITAAELKLIERILEKQELVIKHGADFKDMKQYFAVPVSSIEQIKNSIGKD